MTNHVLMTAIKNDKSNKDRVYTVVPSKAGRITKARPRNNNHNKNNRRITSMNKMHIRSRGDHRRPQMTN